MDVTGWKIKSNDYFGCESYLIDHQVWNYGKIDSFIYSFGKTAIRVSNFPDSRLYKIDRWELEIGKNRFYWRQNKIGDITWIYKSGGLERETVIQILTARKNKSKSV